MKRLLLLVSLLLPALFLAAKEYTVELDAVPGEAQIFFLDLGGTGADSATFRLTTPDGRPVRFSFDMQLSRVVVEGQFQSPVNGYYSKEFAPASERRFEHPGFLSFKAVPGVKKYIFKFRDGAKETRSLPDPAVRGWWIELMRDPYLTNPRYVAGPRGRYKMIPGGGVEFTAAIHVPRSSTIVDERVNGRRFFALVRCEGQFNLFAVRLRNAVLTHLPVVSCYFPPRPGVMQDICAEGLLPAKDAIDPKVSFWTCHYVKGPSVLKELHVQTPPVGRELGVSLKSDLFNEGDVIGIVPHFGIGEFPVPFESGGIKGKRYAFWRGEWTVSSILADEKGRPVLKGSGRELSLRNIKEGSYTLTVRLSLDGSRVREKRFPV